MRIIGTRSIGWTLVVAAVCLLSTPLSTAAQQPPSRDDGSSGRVVDLLDGVRLEVPDGWYVSEREMRYAVELVTPSPEESRGLPDARVLVTWERRRSHAEALERLREIAQEVPARGQREIRYEEVAGWPALIRRYRSPIELRGQAFESNQPPISEIEPRLALRVTVAIAAGDLIVRFDGDLAPDTDPVRADEVEAIARRTRIGKTADPATVAKEIEALRGDEPFAALDRDRGTELDLSARLHRPGTLARLDRTRLGGPAGPAAVSGAATGTPVSVQGGVGEVSIAVSANGQNVVIGANSGFSFSNDGGQTFNFGGGTPAPFPRDGDPSLAWGQSGAFYYGFIGFPNGTPAAGGVSGCSTGISRSTTNGATFTFQNHAVLCPLAGASLCFPDQEHIAADRFNAGSGGDQVYSVWRNFTPSGNPLSCNQIGSGFVTPSIVCSQDSGATWTAPATIASGDFPRVTVGSDGRVYAVFRQGGNVMLHRFSSCANGLVPQVGFPVVAGIFASVACPVPGLDRCNNGNLLSSPTVAVDDTNPNHVYVAFATGAGAGNENVVVRDSTDGGATWTGTATLNGGATARRFMPWVCSVGGRAYSTWYDRRAATGAATDRTDFFVGGAGLQGGVLQPGVEANLSVNADPQCATGWPCRSRSVQDSESCSVQPQLAGRCDVPGGGGSLTPCDYSAPGCPAGEICLTGGGCPKYGDYNGIACASGRVYTAWASATAPPGLPTPTGIRIYSSVLAASDFYVRDWTDSPTSGDDGAEPSTHAAFYVSSDVWNRRSTDPGSFPNDQPENENAGNGAGAVGDNWAFARIRRNGAPLTGDATVTAHFLVSKLGTGSNYVDASSADPDVTFSGSGPTVVFAAGDLGPQTTVAYPWHLSAVSSTHLCLAVEISSVGDPYDPPSLVGSAPGWPATDTRVLEDNNKAQRNMGLSTTPASGAGTGFSSFAIAHNAATFRRDMEIAWRVPEALAGRVRELGVRVVGERQVHREPKGRLVLEGMEPGENRWIELVLAAPDGDRGEILPVLFTEVVDGKPVNGFGLGVRVASEGEALRDAVERHRSTFIRLAAGFQASVGWEEEKRALDLLRREEIRDEAYRALLEGSVETFQRALTTVLGDERPTRLDRSEMVSQPEDLFGLARSLRRLAQAVERAETADAISAHLDLLHRIDSDLTRRQLAEGDPADILQMVRWQEELFAERLPRAGVGRRLGCFEALARSSREFIDGYVRRRVDAADYPGLIERSLGCLTALSRAVEGEAGKALAGSLGRMEKALGSPGRLQRAHREMLLGLQKLAR